LSSGESGAGKTESAKFVVNYIIELCRPKLDEAADVNLRATSNLEEQILQVNPLLEAFGMRRLREIQTETGELIG
jgi:myosin heavy subunit